MLEEQELKSYLEAARIASSVRATAEELAVEGAKLLDVAKGIEDEITKAGGGIAFPVNTSINEEAAHYTPKISDERVLKKDDVVKVDFGVHVEGCVIDQAFSVNPSNEHAKLVEASEAALRDALAVMKAGVCVKDIGAAIESAIVSRGFKPIENLCGHSLEPYVIHAGESIPNVPKGDYVLQEGDVFAVEPFATTGAGKVEDGSFCEIYSLANPRNVRLPQSRKVLEFIMEERQTLPFAKRHLLKCLSGEGAIDLALADLSRQEIIHSYPVLKEVNGGIVSQAETTVIVEKDSVKVLA